MLSISENFLYALYSLNVDTMFLYSPLNLYLIILWILDLIYIIIKCAHDHYLQEIVVKIYKLIMTIKMLAKSIVSFSEIILLCHSK